MAGLCASSAIVGFASWTMPALAPSGESAGASAPGAGSTATSAARLRVAVTEDAPTAPSSVAESAKGGSRGTPAGGAPGIGSTALSAACWRACSRKAVMGEPAIPSKPPRSSSPGTTMLGQSPLTRAHCGGGGARSLARSRARGVALAVEVAFSYTARHARHAHVCVRHHRASRASSPLLFPPRAHTRTLRRRRRSLAR